MMICFDWYFPESARTLALRGAQIIAHPSNLVLPTARRPWSRAAWRTGCSAITTNRWGTETLGEKSLTFTGASQLVDPPGRALASGARRRGLRPAGGDRPGSRGRQAPDDRNHLLNDRRPEMYA